jgi:hypothetical protein
VEEGGGRWRGGRWRNCPYLNLRDEWSYAALPAHVLYVAARIPFVPYWLMYLMLQPAYILYLTGSCTLCCTPHTFCTLPAHVPYVAALCTFCTLPAHVPYVAARIHFVPYRLMYLMLQSFVPYMCWHALNPDCGQAHEKLCLEKHHKDPTGIDKNGVWR